MRTLLWLDDKRNPFKGTWVAEYAPYFHKHKNDTEIIWVRSYREFITYIENNGLPSMVAFDHDLADEHYRKLIEEGAYELDEYDSFIEKTGYDAAKWLVDYVVENDETFPQYTVQSANPIGKENIIRYIRNAKINLDIG